jgi:hypothetical protein
VWAIISANQARKDSCGNCHSGLVVEMEICEFVKTLRQLPEDDRNAPVFIVEDGKPGQWAVEIVRPAKIGEIRPTETKSGVRTAVIAPSDDGQEGAVFTPDTLIGSFDRGWPTEGSVCAEFVPAVGGEIRLGNIRRVECKILVEMGNRPTRVVAIVVGE